MSYVVDKRPVDIIDHSLDFTGYLPEGMVVGSATVKVVGEGDNALSVQQVIIASPLVTVRLSGGTAGMIYQVYVTASFRAPT